MTRDTKYEYTWEAWVEAFQIFARYEPNQWANVAAEHDEIYAGPSVDKVSEADKARLQEIGWLVDDDLNSFCRMV